MIWGGSSKRVKSLLSGFIAVRKPSNESVVALARRAPPCLHPDPGAARRGARDLTRIAALDRAAEVTARRDHVLVPVRAVHAPVRARAHLPQDLPEDLAPEAEAILVRVPVQGLDLVTEHVLGGNYFSLFDSQFTLMKEKTDRTL